MAIRVIEGGRGRRKKKDKGRQLARKYDTKWLGTEPTWEVPVTEEDRTKRRSEALKWYNYFQGPGDYPAEVKALAEKLGLDINGFEEIRWQMFSPVAAFYSRMASRGYELDEHETKFFQDNFVTRIKAAQEKIANAPKERVRVDVRKYSRHIEDLDAVEDCWMLKREAPVVNIVQSNIHYRENMKEVRQQVLTWCNGRINEYELFLSGDKDVREGYKNLENKDARARINWMKEIIKQIEAFFSRPDRPKKERKKKVIPPEKLIKGFRYAAEKDGFKSVNPKDIIGAKAVLLYNPGGRFFAIVEAQAGAVLSVKGSTIIYTDSCKVTKLRKPEEFLPSIKDAPLQNVKVKFNALTTKIMDGKPKSNGDTIVLKVYR